MAQSNTRSGRPRKYRKGWESANARIYLSNETLVEWRRLHSEQGLASNNAVTTFLLERNKLLTNVMELQLQLEVHTTVINRLVGCIAINIDWSCVARPLISVFLCSGGKGSGTLPFAVLCRESPDFGDC